ncbi:MAG TPA: ElyC/SanA/YdcF family protein, partial [Longimicrobiales bacterium]|nr:ElyC/SanA/YdcF family protein [Longimicrobiales bacterium]
SAIMIEKVGLTSAQSVGSAAALMREKDLTTALIVSDSYHMMRLVVLARRNGIRPYRAPARNAPIDLATRQMRWRYVLRESALFPATALLGAR